MAREVTYERPLAARFRIERSADRGERVVIPAQRNVFVMAFLTVWLCGWTVGGVTALSSLFVKFVPFLLVWCFGWVLGEAFVLATLVWMAVGKESLRVTRGDLEATAEIPGYARRRLYRGADVRDLAVASAPAFAYNRRADLPLLFQPGSGGVKFTYGARTVYAGVGLDESEGRLVVDWLKTRLPKTATAGR